MIQYNIFPGGKRKVVTFSYDDGHENDIKLTALFNKYDLKGTFHLNSSRFGELTEKKIAELRARYAGHEISCHTVNHGWPYIIPAASLVNEVFGDRVSLEKIADYPVTGMSYPSGNYSDEAIKVMTSCGIVYSRTTLSTNSFDLPKDFMKWHPTCHHDSMEKSISDFLQNIDSQWTGPLLYIWGHSYELSSDELWEKYENNLKKIANNPKIWYATNIEIYRYIQAQRSLVVSADENIVYNPSAVTVYIEKNKSKVIEIKPGETWRDTEEKN